MFPDFQTPIFRLSASPGHHKLDDQVDKVARREDRKLLRESYGNAATMVLDTVDGMLAAAGVGCGDLQGTEHASYLLVDTYHPILDAWRRNAEDALLQVVNPFTHTEQDMSLSSYPDDVANAKNFEVVDNLQEQVANEDALFDMWLADIETAQNVDKQEYVVHVCGKGKWAQVQELYNGTLPGRILPAIKYLGAWLQHNGNNDTNITH